MAVDKRRPLQLCEAGQHEAFPFDAISLKIYYSKLQAFRIVNEMEALPALAI